MPGADTIVPQNIPSGALGFGSISEGYITGSAWRRIIYEASQSYWRPINALAASDAVLIPIQCEYYALEGLGQLLNTIRLVQKHINKGLTIAGVLLTMYDSRLNLSKEVADEVREYFEEKLFETVIHRNVRLGEAPSFGKPALLYDANSTGAQNYLSLVEELIKRVK